jgi:ubiquinone/menaquinone biosynthesis C-methylase UbiE
MNEKTFHGDIERLRRPERLAALEVPRVAGLCLDDTAISSALDIGCGSGIFSEAFCGRGLFCAAIDLNPAMLAAARSFAPQAHVAAALDDKLPFADKSFDLVFMAHLLHEVDDPAATLAECGRVAKKRIAVLEWPYRQQEMGPPLEHRLSEEAIAKAALDVGLAKAQPMLLTHLVFYRFDL